MTDRLAHRLLLATLVVAFVLRIVALDAVPSELIVDELDLYNSAHSIVTTGHDVDGSLLPFLWCSFTRNPPMYAVAEVVTSALVGDGPLGLRLPAVLFGVLTVWLVSAIAFELSRRRDVALLAAVFTATAPIFIHFSRIGWEPASELPFLLGGLLFMLRAVRASERGERIAPSLIAAAALLGLTAYTYMAGWFYAVVLAGGLALLARRALFRDGLAGPAVALLVGIVIATPALWMWFFDPSTAGRTQRVATFATGVNPATLLAFARNYLAHFGWRFLAGDGDPVPAVTWRYLAGFGAFSGWVVALAAAGVVAGRRAVRGWPSAWLLWWLAVYPLGGALTNDGGPNAPRTLAGAPAFAIWAALGAVAVGALASRLRPAAFRRAALPVLSGALGLALTVSVAGFTRFYFTRFAEQFPGAWDSGTRATFAVLRAHAPGHQRLCFAVRPASYGVETYQRYYLRDVPLVLVTDVTQPACFAPGTLLVTERPAQRAGFVPIATVLEIGGGPFAVIAARP